MKLNHGKECLLKLMFWMRKSTISLKLYSKAIFLLTRLCFMKMYR